jgi:hypothetical protein
MTEQPLLPPPDETPDPEPVVVTPRPPQRNLVPWFYGLGFLILAAGIFYVWQFPSTPGEPPGEASAVQAVEQRLADIDGRLTRLEQRPTVDLGSITARLDALDGRVGDQTQLASRVDTLSGRIDSLSGRVQTSLDAAKQQLDAAKQQLDALTSRVGSVETNAGSLDSVNQRLSRISKLQEAFFALGAGRPIGDLPNAPDALARYAHTAPPTEAQLRLRFPRDAQVALAARQSDDSDTPFAGRVWERAQGLVTIRRGDDIVVGNQSATVLSHAQAALDAGDIAGAVYALNALKGAPGQAMANWLADAKALLGARSALADMADQA